MDERTLKDRTKRFALAVISLVEALRARELPTCWDDSFSDAEHLWEPTTEELVAAGRPPMSSRKLAIVEEEAGEWLDLLMDARVVSSNDAASLKKEADELVAMTVASIKTLRRRSTGS